jgi:hypothetical protein
LGDRHANDYGGTFSGFDWCLNRENLIVTYSKRSTCARFWDLTSCDQPIAFKEELLSKGVKRGDEHPAVADVKPSQSSQPLAAGSAVSVDEEYINRPQAVSPSNLPVEQYRCMDCKDQILSLAWKPRAMPQSSNAAKVETTKSSRSVTNSIDKNKFVIFTSKGNVQEFTFAEKSFSVLGLSCKGEVCMSM